MENTVYPYSNEYRAASRPALSFPGLKAEACRALGQACNWLAHFPPQPLTSLPHFMAAATSAFLTNCTNSLR